MKTETKQGKGGKERLTVEYGLHSIKGQRPYFSVTGTLYELRRGRWIDAMGGCLHETIAEWFPGRFDDLIALHLSDDDGVPMHAEANGWYWLCGAARGYMGIPDHFQQDYHGGNDSRKRDAAECLGVLARHLRVDVAEAGKLVDAICDEARRVDPPMQAKAARAAFGRAVEGMRLRWKAEADAAIARHGLAVCPA